MCRRRGVEFLSLTGKVEGKRDRGKQRITFLDSLCNSATGGQSKGLNFLKLSDDRDVWRGMVANVCSRDLAPDDDDDDYVNKSYAITQQLILCRNAHYLLRGKYVLLKICRNKIYSP